MKGPAELSRVPLNSSYFKRREAHLVEQVVMVVVLMRLLPGLVRCLAVLEVGMACLPIMGIGSLGGLMAAAVASHRRGRRYGERGTGQEERRGCAKKYFVKHKVTPVREDSTLRGAIRPQPEYSSQQRFSSCGEFDRMLMLFS